MSTIDPARVRDQKQAQATGGAGSFVSALLAAAACAVTGYLFGRGLAGIFGVFREMAFEGISEQSSSEGPPWFWGLFVGVFVGTAAQMWFAWSAGRCTGRRGLPTGFAWASAGATYGIWLQVQEWVGPARLGYTTLWGSPEPWGAWAWIMYHAKTWLPVGAAAITVLTLFFGIWRAARRSARARHAEQLLATGRRVGGVVTEATWTGADVDGRKLVSFTVRFTDDQGVQRWVTKKSTFDPTALPSAGMPATVLYDPLDMDEGKIAVVLEPLDAVEQRIRESQGESSGSLGSVDVGAWAMTGGGRSPAGSPGVTAVTVNGRPIQDVVDRVAATPADTMEARPAWGQVTDVVTTPTASGTAATFTVRIADDPQFTTTIQATFAAGSPRGLQWCRIGARIPILVWPGSPPVAELDPRRF